MRASGHTAVMAGKASGEAIEAEADPLRRLHLRLEFFPTPPWATRALMEHVLPGAAGRAWDPAAGEGHMAAVLAERFDEVFRSDVHDYGGLHAVGSFTGAGQDVVAGPAPRADWIITNPPFTLAAPFARRAIAEAARGVALLVRTQWLEGAVRHRDLFAIHQPATIALFCERVPMVAGRWDPAASTATSYCWVVWDRAHAGPPRFTWIPPGTRARLTRPDDVQRFAQPAATEGEPRR